MYRKTGSSPSIMVQAAIVFYSRNSPKRIAGTLKNHRYVSEVLEPDTVFYLQGLPIAKLFQWFSDVGQEGRRTFGEHVGEAMNCTNGQQITLTGKFEKWFVETHFTTVPNVQSLLPSTEGASVNN
ncbi:hypothetical protein TNCV_4193791 [Trichonephila clavipes]|nr:hypothetical protein TNCV_4193791 [Trichonephila clavipes]